MTDLLVMDSSRNWKSRDSPRRATLRYANVAVRTTFRNCNQEQLMTIAIFRVEFLRCFGLSRAVPTRQSDDRRHASPCEQTGMAYSKKGMPPFENAKRVALFQGRCIEESRTDAPIAGSALRPRARDRQPGTFLIGATFVP